jgi:hypothetical protein
MGDISYDAKVNNRLLKDFFDDEEEIKGEEE